MAVTTDEELIAKYPGITIDYDSREYWRGCLERKLVLAHCASCGHWIHFPRPMCPKCWSDDIAYQQVSGKGTIFSFVVFHQPDGRHRDSDISPASPYIMAAVELVQQPRLRMPAPIVNAHAGPLNIGMPVRLTWVDYQGSPVPAFEPDPEQAR